MADCIYEIRLVYIIHISAAPAVLILLPLLGFESSVEVGISISMKKFVTNLPPCSFINDWAKRSTIADAYFEFL